mgnify:CR=1 FL=1
MKCKILFLVAIATMSFQVMAESKTIDQMISSMKLEKMQAEVMINRLAQSGRFNSEEAQRAKREIASVQEESVQEMKSSALEKIQASKSFANK